MTDANARQVGGNHYRNKIQHWDWVASNELDYFQGQITKYVARWKLKGGIQDLEKARHFLDKYIELQGKDNTMADVTINVTGVSTNTTVDASGSNSLRYDVVRPDGTVVQSYDDFSQAKEFLKATDFRYKIVDTSSEAGPSYVDQG